MTKSTITRERLELIANFHRAKTLPPSHDEIEELARMALAAMDSEPVGYMYRDNLHSDARFSLESKIGNWSPEDINEYEISETPLYRHAQPVPVSLTEAQRDMLRDMDDEIVAALEEEEKSCRDGIRKCIASLRYHHKRAEAHSTGYKGSTLEDDTLKSINFLKRNIIAAMLQAGNSPAQSDCCPAQNSVTPAQGGNSPVIPEGYVMVPKEPTKEMIDAGWLHFMGTKNPSSKGTYKAMLEAAPHDTPVLNSVQSVVTVPGKWIPVSERMPEEGGRYLAWIQQQNDLGLSQWADNVGYQPDSLGFRVAGRVTHWMPLPARPQEVKP